MDAELACCALQEMCHSLALDAAALYLPAGGRLALERLAVTSGRRRAVERLVLDEEAWRLVVEGSAPLVIRDRGEWLMEHPFTPAAERWLVFPLGTGAVLAALDLPCPRS